MKTARYHPWRELRRRPHVEVVWTDLAGGLHARTNGVDKIVMDRRLSQVERRIAAGHEHVHFDFGHVCGQDEPIERMVRLEVARRFIPIALLGDALAYSLDLDEVAFDIWVTRSVLDDRLSELTGAETLYLQSRTVHHRGEES